MLHTNNNSLRIKYLVSTLTPNILRVFLCCLAIGNAWSAEGEDLTNRPDAGDSPTLVQVTLYVLDIVSINSERRSFNADFMLRLRWKDQRLADEGRRFSLNEVWNPRLGILNERNTKTGLGEFIEVLEDGTAQYSQRYQGEFSAKLDFHAFPFDVQSLPINLISFGYSPEEVTLEIESAGSVENLSVSGWVLELQKGEAGTISADLFGGSRESIKRPGADFTIRAERDVTYYRWKILIPLTIVVFLSWAVFWIDPQHIGPKIAVSATSILTLVAFLIRLDSMLPPVSYLTNMDRFVYMTLLLVFFAYVVALSSSRLAVSDSGMAMARTMDKCSRVLFPVAYAVVVFVFWVG